MRPANTQISLGTSPVWSESSLSSWSKLGSLANHWVHSEDSDQTERMPRLIWVFAGRTCHLKKSPHDNTNKMACAPSEDSGHPPCLISVFAVHMKKAWVLSYPPSAQRRLWSDWVMPSWSRSSLGAHAILLVLSWGGSFNSHFVFSAWNLTWSWALTFFILLTYTTLWANSADN